jgi:hypothetical protein
MIIQIENKSIGGYFVDARLEIKLSDQGIGAYEFWGAKCHDTRMGIDKISVLEASYCADQELDNPPPYSAKEWLDRDENIDDLFDAAEEGWANSQSEEPDDYDPVDEYEKKERREHHLMDLDKEEE